MSDARTLWAEMCYELEGAAARSKESQYVVIELSRRYAALSPEDKLAVDELLAEWVLSDDACLQFDALALISEHNIRSAIPSLRELAARLEQSNLPLAPDDWAWVNRILGQLTT
jgi:hypothetical protein